MKKAPDVVADAAQAVKEAAPSAPVSMKNLLGLAQANIRASQGCVKRARESSCQICCRNFSGEKNTTGLEDKGNSPNAELHTSMSHC